MKKTLTIITILIAFFSGIALHRLAVYRSADSPKKLKAIIESRDIELNKLTTELAAEQARTGELEASYATLKDLIENERTANEKVLVDYSATKKSAETLNRSYEKLVEHAKSILGTGKGIPPNIEEVILNTAELEHQLPKPLLKELQKYPAFKDFQEMLLQLRKRPALL